MKIILDKRSTSVGNEEFGTAALPTVLEVEIDPDRGDGNIVVWKVTAELDRVEVKGNQITISTWMLTEEFCKARLKLGIFAKVTGLRITDDEG